MRVHRILESSTARSVVILNEFLNSTTLEDALDLGTRVMDHLIDLDVLAVYVTFVDELASRGPSVVSLMSQVEPDNPAVRTFKVVRQPANGMAGTAAAIARKYRGRLRAPQEAGDEMTAMKAHLMHRAADFDPGGPAASARADPDR